jgi:hypothetical protein
VVSYSSKRRKENPPRHLKITIKVPLPSIRSSKPDSKVELRHLRGTPQLPEIDLEILNPVHLVIQNQRIGEMCPREQPERPILNRSAGRVQKGGILEGIHNL